VMLSGAKIEVLMATAAKLPDYPHIIATPGVCSGRPRIDGTRIRVMDVVWAFQAGQSLTELETYFDMPRPLTPAEIHSALAYYYDHKAEVDEAFAADARLTKEGEAREAELLRRRDGR